MYWLNERGLLLFYTIIFLLGGYNIFKIEDRKIVCKINKKGLFILGCVVILVTLYQIYARGKEIKPDIIGNTDGEKIEISLQYLGKLQAHEEKEFHGNKEMMEKYTSWWQKRCDFNGFLGIEISDWDLDFVNHYYIITYGRPVIALYYDTAKWYNYGSEDWAGYSAFIESDMEVSYQSGVVYLYEMDKIDLATTEF